MRKASFVLATFVIAFIVGVIWPMFASDTIQAKPFICKLAVEPFLVCEPSNRCQGAGEQFCWECQGVDTAGEPCLCHRVGCMVP